MFHSIVEKFSLTDAKKVKSFERVTKHDVKAIEYFLKEKLGKSSLKDILPFIHFGLTSEDVNNLAYGCMLTESKNAVIVPRLESLLKELKILANNNGKSYMVARTHGQPAVPTTFGKEMAVFYARIATIEKKLRTFRFDAKLNGAVGNYNALAFAYPKINWLRFGGEFISSIGLTPNLITTQILPADNFVEYGFLLYQLNTILIGFCQDMWSYISRGLVAQVKDARQVGSSTMPQKINPIHFENAEGNLQIANSFFELFARKFPVSRLQRDLSDSTVKRSIGSALAYTTLAWETLEKGLGKISFDRNAASSELDGHWEVLAEAMQIYFKLHGDEQGYEKVKEKLMGKKLTEKEYKELVSKYPSLARLTPRAYIGLAEKIVKKIV